MRNISILILILATAAGCKKKYQCMHPYSNRQLLIGFTGFQQAELQAVELRTYKADGLFDSLVSVTVYADSDFHFHSDTATPEFSPVPTSDYIINIPATGNSYHLSHMTYIDNSGGVPYTRESPCNNMAYVRPPDSITINGVRCGIQTYYGNGGTFDIYLAK